MLRKLGDGLHSAAAKLSLCVCIVFIENCRYFDDQFVHLPKVLTYGLFTARGASLRFAGLLGLIFGLIDKRGMLWLGICISGKSCTGPNIWNLRAWGLDLRDVIDR